MVNGVSLRGLGLPDALSLLKESERLVQLIVARKVDYFDAFDETDTVSSIIDSTTLENGPPLPITSQPVNNNNVVTTTTRSTSNFNRHRNSSLSGAIPELETVDQQLQDDYQENKTNSMVIQSFEMLKILAQFQKILSCYHHGLSPALIVNLSSLLICNYFHTFPLNLDSLILIRDKLQFILHYIGILILFILNFLLNFHQLNHNNQD